MTLSKTLLRNSTLAAGATMLLAGAPAFADHHKEDGAYKAGDHEIEHVADAKATLDHCREVAETCSADIDGAAGVLVFPEVWKADLIVGGAGGEGVLFIDGEPQGQYYIGKGSVGLQAGVDQSEMVYVFREQDALDELMDGDEWEMGAAAGATVVEADANAMAATGDPRIYILNAEGLNAELSISALRIWQDDDPEADDDDDMDDVDMDIDDDDDMDHMMHDDDDMDMDDDD